MDTYLVEFSNETGCVYISKAVPEEGSRGHSIFWEEIEVVQDLTSAEDYAYGVVDAFILKGDQADFHNIDKESDYDPTDD